MSRFWSPALFTLIWIVLVGIAVIERPPMLVDETRYLAVAWEMWQHGDFLVPHLNGETYSHKPPLLFWLMNVGWAVFGVNDWWPPLVAPLFGLASLFLLGKIASCLWPGERQIADLAPIILLGAAFWTLFTTLTMFDMMVAACTLLGIYGILLAWSRGGKCGFVILAFAIGLGVLAKGPVILLQVLPVALLAPWWDRDRLILERDFGWKRWYLSILYAVLGGAAIGLAWAIPAGIAGGEEYRDAIFWGQTAGRMVKSFAHNRPVWWYLAVIGPLLLPWVIWGSAWRAFWQARSDWGDPGLRFCLAWFVPIFIAFSLISGKQLHYLLPIFPAFALAIAFVMTRYGQAPSRLARALACLPFVAIGIALCVLPILGIPKKVLWLNELDWIWGGVLAVLAGYIALTPKVKSLNATISAMSVMMAIVVTSIHFEAAPRLKNSFSMYDFAGNLRALEQEGYRFGHIGKYHGTFQFLGRLEHPIAELGFTSSDIEEWLAQNPKAKIISYAEDMPQAAPGLEIIKPYRNDFVLLWDGDAVRDDPSLAHRPD